MVLKYAQHIFPEGAKNFLGGLSPPATPWLRAWMAPGARSKFGAPMFETEVFRKQMYCIEECTCDIVGTFWLPRSHSAPPAVTWRPHSDSAPGNCVPLTPLVTPLPVT